MENNFYENDFVSLEFRDKILYAKYKVSTIDLNAAKNATKFRMSITNGKKVPAIVDISSVKHVDKATRIFFSSSEAGRDLLALAVILSNPVTRMMGNFFIKFYQPEYPFKFFTSLNEAVEWIEDFTK
ncbi:MAG: hypothetical protein AAF992_05765 [Bacteroidota bacterium]